MNPGLYRRAIRLQRTGRTVTAEMEDDFHHFRVQLEHDDKTILAMHGESLRFPWTTCGEEAASELSVLSGLPLASLRDQLEQHQRWRQCTHLFDLAELAVAHVDRDTFSALYEVAVQVEPGCGAVWVELKQDLSVTDLLRIDNGVIESPETLSGLRIDQLKNWATAQADPAVVERYAVLQRAVHVSYGRVFDWSFARSAADMGLEPTCFTFSQDNARRATPIEAHARDYTNSADNMLVEGIQRLADPI